MASSRVASRGARLNWCLASTRAAPWDSNDTSVTAMSRRIALPGKLCGAEHEIRSPTFGRCWDFARRRVSTTRLELRLPNEQEPALAAIAARGVHPPERMPLIIAWTDATPADRARAVLQLR